MCGKWLQQIGDIVPKVKKIAVLWDATTGTYQSEAIKAAAAASIELVVMEFRDSTRLETALEQGLNEAPQAVIQLGSPLIRQGGSRVGEILSARRIPGILQFRTFPDGGGLMSYGPDLIALYRRVGPQISKCSMAPTQPICQSTKFEFVINLKAAKALSVTVPGSLLAVADEVIE